MKQRNFLKSYFAFLFLILASLACSRLLGTPVPQTAPPATPAPVTETPPLVPVQPGEGSAGLGDSLYPNFGNGGYQVDHYTLDITVLDVSTSEMTVTATLASQATQDLSRFNLDFIGFDITSITVNGAEADFTRNGQELSITPSTPLAKGETFTVEVKYEGSPEALYSVALPIQTGWVTFEGGSFVLSEPDGSASFYPVNDHPLDKAFYTFIVTVPKPFEVAANGVLTDSTDNGESTTYQFEVREPMASYLATVNIDDFDLETMESPGGIPIRNYYDADLPNDINQPFARQGEMLDYFSEIFGPYPFEVYGSLVLNTEFGAALENQTMSIYGVDMIDFDDVEGTELVVAHELTHQWYGDSISVADWSNIWLNEGFATYGEGLWVEHTQGREALDEWATQLYEEVNAYSEYYPAPGNPPADNLFNGGVYVRGGLTLHALRLEVGDETFFDILKTYHDRFKGGNASTDDFIALAEELSGKDLGGFFNSWLYEEQLPPIPQMGLGE